MESALDPSKKQLLDKLRQILEKSMEPNFNYIQNGSGYFPQLAISRLDLSDVTGGGWMILNRTVIDYVRWSAGYTSHFIGLVVEVTEGLLE